MTLPEASRIGKRKIRCEFEDEYGERCRRRATSVDHMTPQCFARIGWITEAELNHPDNLQYLCRDHHELKDKDTAARKRVLEYQLAGKLFVGLGQHEQAMAYVQALDSIEESARARELNERRRIAQRQERYRLRRVS